MLYNDIYKPRLYRFITVQNYTNLGAARHMSMPDGCYCTYLHTTSYKLRKYNALLFSLSKYYYINCSETMQIRQPQYSAARDKLNLHNNYCV